MSAILVAADVLLTSASSGSSRFFRTFGVTRVTRLVVSAEKIRFPPMLGQGVGVGGVPTAKAAPVQKATKALSNSWAPLVGDPPSNSKISWLRIPAERAPPDSRFFETK